MVLIIVNDLKLGVIKQYPLPFVGCDRAQGTAGQSPLVLAGVRNTGWLLRSLVWALAGTDGWCGWD